MSDALDANHIPGFDETNLSNDWGRIILEAAGSAGIAGLTGGNVGAATASSAVGSAVIPVAGQGITNVVGSVVGADKDQIGQAITSIFTNLAANGGALIGAAIDGGSGALNGSTIGSMLEAYNAQHSGVFGKLWDKFTLNNVANTLSDASHSAVVNATVGASYGGAVTGATAGAVAGGGIGSIPGAAGGGESGFLVGAGVGGAAGAMYGFGSTLSEHAYNSVIDAINESNAEDQSAQNKTQPQGNTSVSASAGSPMPDGDGGDKKGNGDQSNTEPQKTEDIIKNENGNLQGDKRPGSDNKIRTLTKEEFQTMKDALMKGAEKIRDYSNGEGEWYRRPDGSEFGIRNSKESGETIDIMKPAPGSSVRPNTKFHQ
ncbi:hypothetical protein [Commensalibacter nepenthis]|uniref:Uncharacterized protein n=1 Tax=Commensalibacter nepenthis TaxID=3043872 RepID=A0ABT6QAN0_9PROT|nr:hypothetical protein [Commensalibacter sp. TBRC 10068]MDI2113849.1 hypothetical protein [Commensalibacter sp. TBRC 10068]